MIKKAMFCLFFLATAIACKKEKTELEIIEETPVVSLTQALEFRLEVVNNKEIITTDIICSVDEDKKEITAIIPGIESKKDLIISFNKELATVKISDIVQESGVTINNFSKPLTYSIVSEDGIKEDYKFTITNFTGIPIFHISTSSPVNSKDVYVKGQLVINPNARFDQEKEPVSMEIKGRGNSTWGMPKKPYRLKLDSKTKILGLPAAKNWVLLANYADKTLIRTSFAFSLGQMVGADFTPHGIPVEVVMNNQYLGSYLLTEQVEVNENRVNITELKPENTSIAQITGGYLLELDERRDEDFWFETKKKLPFAVKSPKEINTAQKNYIKTYMQEAEDVIYSSDFADPVKGYAKYINVNSFINWFLVQELLKNQDARNYSSMYYYKNRDGKLGMGPLWDFDLAMGNVDYSDAINPRGWWVRNGLWFNRLFQDPAFKQKVRNRWDEIKDKEIAEAFKNIDKNAAYLEFSQRENFKKWNILNEIVWPNPQVFRSYEGEVKQIKSWLTTRIAWLDENL